MSITLKNINELTPNEANANDKIAFGKPNNTELFSEGVGALIARFASGIEDFSYQVIPIPVLLTDPLPSTSLSLTVNNLKGMITFIRVNVLVDDSLGSDTYLLLKGEGTHTGLIYNDLLRVDRKEGDVESSPNTDTYVVNSLNEINESVNPFDFSDEDLFYFLRIDSSLFSFIGANGFYGLNDLQMTEQDIQLVGGANDVILDNQLNINSSNGVQNSVILSEFLRTNYLGIKLDDSILTQSGLEAVNYKFLHKIENNNVSVLGRFDAPIDFNCYGIVEQGSITFSVQAGLVLLAPNGTTVNVGEYFHFNKINDGKTYVLIRAFGGGANQTLDQVLSQGNETNSAIIFNGGRFVLNPSLSDFSLDSRVLLIGFNSEQEILTLSSDLTESREQTFQDKNGLIATLEDIQLRKKGVIVHNSGVSVILNESVNVLINDNQAKVQVTIPSPTTNKGREITFTALGDDIELSEDYTDTNGFVSNLILKGFSITLISTGSRYQLISGIN